MKAHCTNCNLGIMNAVITQLAKSQVDEYNKGLIKKLLVKA